MRRGAARNSKCRCTPHEDSRGYESFARLGGCLKRAGHDAIHWSAVGKATDDDRTILQWARQEDQLLFTHDLDFGALLASTRGAGPSVLQIRTHDVLPDAIGALVLSVLTDHADAISQGALISVDEASARIRILPIR